MDSAVGVAAKLPVTPLLPVLSQGKVGDCVFSDAVSAVCSVELLCGSVVVFAGAGVVSAGLAVSLMRSQGNDRVAGDAQVGKVACEVSSLFVSSGLVTCMSVSFLPGGGVALGVAGTSHGSLCIFVVESHPGGAQPVLFKLCEVFLCDYTDGRVGVDDIVTDVCIGLDPAGQPEFIAASSASDVIVIDMQFFDETIRENATEALMRAFGRQQQSRVAGRPPSEMFSVTFAASEVVRVLVPQRYHAAFSVDVALVIVLDNGEVRYVERSIVGGSLQLLQEHCRQRQARHSEVGLSMLRGDGNEDLVCGSQVLPYMLYAYNLSKVVHNVCAGADGSHAAAQITVNDAALRYDAGTHQMQLVVVGGEIQTTERPGKTGGTHGWWAVAQGVVCARGTLSQPQLTVSSFTGPKSASVPRDRRGLAALLVTLDGTLLFACSNEVYACTMTEAVTGGGGGGHSTLQQVHVCGSVVSGMAVVDARFGGKCSVVVACDNSLILLLL